MSRTAGIRYLRLLIVVWSFDWFFISILIASLVKSLDPVRFLASGLTGAATMMSLTHFIAKHLLQNEGLYTLLADEIKCRFGLNDDDIDKFCRRPVPSGYVALFGVVLYLASMVA